MKKPRPSDKADRDEAIIARARTIHEAAGRFSDSKKVLAACVIADAIENG